MMQHVRSVLPVVLRKRGVLEHAMASLVLLRANGFLEHMFPHMKGRLRARSFDPQGVLTISAKDGVALTLLREKAENLQCMIEKSLEGQIRIRILAKRG